MVNLNFSELENPILSFISDNGIYVIIFIASLIIWGYICWGISAGLVKTFENRLLILQQM